MSRIMLLAAGVALASSAPAMAQENGAEDAALEAAMAQHDVMTVRNVTRREMERGLPIFDASGKPVGTVAGLSGNDVILTDGAREFAVPITEFFAYNQHGKDYFATRASKTALQAQASSAAKKPLAVVD
ncbi:hypothetical protein [Novosphingobium sp. M1R2S20]|uniref:PRC-barrel domain protein n=1 Tax=Novosphingobium rhizovicinum TaxID=3228928 RepID=A0ABV3RAQ5_9SPHN